MKRSREQSFEHTYLQSIILATYKRLCKLKEEERKEICKKFWKEFSVDQDVLHDWYWHFVAAGNASPFEAAVRAMLSDMELFFSYPDADIQCKNGNDCWYIQNPGNDIEHEHNYYSVVDPENFYYCDACHNTSRCLKPKTLKRIELKAVCKSVIKK